MGIFHTQMMASRPHYSTPLGMTSFTRSGSGHQSHPLISTDLGDPKLRTLVQGLNDNLNWRTSNKLGIPSCEAPEGAFLAFRDARGIDEHGKRVDETQYLFVGNRFRAAMEKLVSLSADDQAEFGLSGTSRFDSIKYTYRIE